MKQFPEWAMLAYNWEDAEVEFPVIVQPKLNGVRAKWDTEHKCFISRSGKLIPRVCIPHLYDKFLFYTGPSLDGELYSRGMPLQTIKGILTQSRKETSPDAHKLDFSLFDLIEQNYASLRLSKLAELHRRFSIVSEQRASSNEDAMYWMDYYVKNYDCEGIMLRQPHGFYTIGRTWNLLKLKPLLRTVCQITEVIEGYGKFTKKLGAFWVMWNGVKFKVGGGNLTTEMRREIWEHKDHYLNKCLEIEYRELTIAGIPSQAQIKKIIE